MTNRFACENNVFKFSNPRTAQKHVDLVLHSSRAIKTVFISLNLHGVDQKQELLSVKISFSKLKCWLLFSLTLSNI